MTNFEIILRDAIAAEIYTKEEVDKFLETQGELPLHTFKIWKDKGYSVKKRRTRKANDNDLEANKEKRQRNRRRKDNNGNDKSIFLYR